MAASESDIDAEMLHRIREICGRFRGADEGQLQERPLFRVGRRRFAIFNGVTSPARKRWDGAGRSLHFLADPDEAEAFSQDSRFRPSPHHGDRGWFAVGLDNPGVVDWGEIGELLEAGYQQVAPSHR